MTAPMLSETHDAETGCVGKHRYPSEQSANEVSAKVWAKRRTWTRAYACPTCGGYHLTSKQALPPANANWRPPAKSQRLLAKERNDRRDRRRRRR